MLIIKFWEIFLKSKSTKKNFTDLLKLELKKKWVKKIKIKNAYIEILDNIDPKLISNIFWVYKVEYINEFNFINNSTDLILKQIFNEIEKKYKNILSKKVLFRITVSRENKKFPLNSLQIQQYIWKLIENKYKLSTVSYKNYDFEIKIRILKNTFRLWNNKDEYKWLWWLPYWIEWNALTLFSWWIDSPVATFLAAKRWIRQDFLFLNIPWSNVLLKQTLDVYNFLKQKYWIEWNFYELNVRNEVFKIKNEINQWNRQIIFKLFLYKISELFWKKLWATAIVNWENIWQVSTQTLTNMALLDKSINTMIIRPVICYDKIDIINIAKQIWTYNLSIKIKEVCSLENHSNSKIKNAEKIMYLYNNLNFNENELIRKIKNIT